MALLSHLLGWAVRETQNVSCISTSKSYSNTPPHTHTDINPHTSNATHTQNIHTHKSACIICLFTSTVSMLVYECGCIFDTCPFDEVTEREIKADPQTHQPIPYPMRTATTERRAAYLPLLLLNFSLYFNSLPLQAHQYLSVPPIGGVNIFVHDSVYHTRASCLLQLPLEYQSHDAV